MIIKKLFVSTLYYMTNISLKQFLKTYTAISNKFIDEYYKFYEMCENDIFGIDAIKIVKYLGMINLTKFHERLRDKYILNEDYVIKKTLNKLSKGVQDTFYFVSFDGFEKICMKSKTEKGNQVRDYFIILRKFIDYYKNNFANNINTLAKSNKSIYILMVNKDKQILKPGMAKNIRKRLLSYATGKDKHPDILFIMLVNDPKQVERCVKIFAKTYKFRGNQELYKMNFDMLKSIVFDCAKLTQDITNKINESDKYDTYVVFDDSKSFEYIDLNNNIIGYEKGIKSKKKISKKISKKLNKKTTKKTTKKSTKKSTKKY